MMVVRGILMGLVMGLVATAVPAHAAAPDASEQVHRQAGKNNWTTVQAWKNGEVRGCRSTWDGDSFYVKVQLVNRAERGRRGARLGFRRSLAKAWETADFAPIGAGKKQTLIEGDVTERPREWDMRAKVTKGKKESRWGQVVRLDQLNIC